MRAKDTFSQAQLRLQAAGCRYRMKLASRSPYIQVYDTLPPRRANRPPAASDWMTTRPAGIWPSCSYGPMSGRSRVARP